MVYLFLQCTLPVQAWLQKPMVSPSAVEYYTDTGKYKIEIRESLFNENDWDAYLVKKCWE